MSEITPNQLPQPQIIDVHLSNQHRLRNRIIAVGMAGLTAFGALMAVDSLGVGGVLKKFGIETPALPKIPNIGKQPDSATATLKPDTYKAEVFKVTCSMRASVGVGVEAEEPGTIGKKTIDDIRWGSFLGCDQNSETSNTASKYVMVQRDGTTNQPVKVTYNGSGLQATQARVDITDPRNCLPLKNGDDKAKIDKEEAKYKAKVAAGKKPDCDLGEDNSVLYVQIGGSTSSLARTVDAATQIAVALNGSVSAAANEFNVEYAKKLKDSLESAYQVPAEVNILDDVTAQAQLDNLKKELEGNLYQVEEVRNKANAEQIDAVIVTGPNDDKVTVKTRIFEPGNLSLTGLIAPALPVAARAKSN